MNALAMHPTLTQRTDGIDWSKRRAPQPPDSLAQHTIRWLAELPVEVRPRRLPVEFARIANRLSGIWADAHAALEYLEDLLIDNRGDRRGFPIQVALELASLKNHYETVIHPVPQTVWDTISEHARRRQI